MLLEVEVELELELLLDRFAIVVDEVVEDVLLLELEDEDSKLLLDVELS